MIKDKVVEWFKDEKNREFIEFVKAILLAIIIALTLRDSVVEANYIFSGSMTPTLLEGDYVLVNKMAYNLRVPFTSFKLLNFDTPDKSDIVTFVYPKDPTKIFVKRVVGLPGDIIEIKDQVLYINHKKIERIETKYANPDFLSYVENINNNKHQIIHHRILHNYYNYGPQIVPENSIFVLGDNRDNSHDSRAWGFVPYDNVLGRAFTIYFSNSENLDWPFPNVFVWVKGIRWNRLGDWLINS